MYYTNLLRFLLIVSGILICACSSSDKADRIFVNGTVITLDGNNTIAEAIAVRKDRILAVGSNREIQALAGTDTETVDLAGKTVLPGFVAAHEHPAISAVFRNFLDMSGFTHASAADAWQALKDEIANTPRGEWVYAMGLDPILLADLQTPDRAQLDALAPHNPVFILAANLHTAWVNSAALAAAGIDESTPAPGDGSYFGRDEDGRLNGMLVEKEAMEPFTAVHKKPLRVAAAYQARLDDLRAAGFTSVASLGFNVPAWLARWAASENFAPRIRQFFYYRGENLTKLDGKPDFDSDFFRVLGAKFWYDGSPYSGTMMVEQPYRDSALSEQLGIGHDSHGEAVITAESFRAQLRDKNTRGWQTATHVQGDRAAQEFIELLQQEYDALDARERAAFIGRRHRLEHGLLVDRTTLSPMAKLGITPSFHINHLYYYGNALKESLLGPARTEQILPVKTAFDLGMYPTLHADSPMFPAEPFSLMQTAITRLSRSGTLIGGHEAISPLQALQAMTINGAWQLGMEQEIGSLEVGKYADLAIVDKNPLQTPAQKWRDIQVLETWIAGRR
ncbi:MULTISPECIES: amidohydrolase [Microbulbifer]|uniref:amidohydrolase n=1 Tax=Microbulbifer TaxID=48073 RepID=UPI001CD78C8D|nr:amidohydrolase [Microbulbifer agarilyticus]MCA0899854.1 amidohydrolase [Microbulbifer agarilyticus]